MKSYHRSPSAFIFYLFYDAYKVCYFTSGLHSKVSWCLSASVIPARKVEKTSTCVDKTLSLSFLTCLSPTYLSSPYHLLLPNMRLSVSFLFTSNELLLIVQALLVVFSVHRQRWVILKSRELGIESDPQNFIRSSTDYWLSSKLMSYAFK